MPELPEVETVKNELAPHVIDRVITGIDITWDKMVPTPTVPEFLARTAGARITGLSRRGKYLFFALSSGEYLVVHLKMTGALLLDENLPDERFIRATIHLDDGHDIHFRDPRKFGRIWLLADKGDIEKKLGPEPLQNDFTPEVFRQRLGSRKAPIKAVLLDQAVLAGVGNMYADEALWAARIHPMRTVQGLSATEMERLYQAVRDVLTSALAHKGASVVTYYRPGGDTGTAHFEFKVAHGQRQTCERCGTKIARVVVRNRGSYFCPKCQLL